jgi:FMN phosphatase YigB (HAD superfamily)
MTTPTLFSYDVFDTALTRLVLNPDHVHWVVGARLRAQGIVPTGEEHWRAARRKAEDGLRSRTPMSEITLAEIYSELAAAISLTQAQMRAAMAIELAEEIRLARPVEAIRDRINRNAREGRQQCFISDTYLTADEVNELLTSCGYAPLTVHASSEYRKTKARGDLFAAVGAHHNIRCRDMAHTGDNAVSDFSRARAAGCEAVLFEESRPTRREQILFAAGTPGFLSSAIAGAARAARLEYAGSCSAGIRTASTSVAGPLLTAYVLWVLLDVVKRGGRTIYFLARDGQILHRICERLITYLKVDVESRYLLGSRRAFFLAALPQDLDGALTSAFALAPSETALSVLISLGFTAADSASIIAEAGISATQRASTISKTGLEAIGARLSNSSARVADFIDRIASAKAATRQYFAQEGVFTAEIAYVADLGWHGNLQLRMQRVIADQTRLSGYYIRLYRTPDEIADDVRSWTNDDWPRGVLLEVFTLADHSSVQGFQLDPVKKAVCAPPLEEEASLVAWGVRHQQELVDLFVRNLLQAVDPSIYEAEKLGAALKESGVAAFNDFVRFPTPAEASAYGSIALAGDQNHLDIQEIAPAMSNLDVVRMLGTGGVRRARTNWFQGSLARSKDKVAPAALGVMFSAIAYLRGFSRFFDMLDATE